jgi:hypothetical protein
MVFLTLPGFPTVDDPNTPVRRTGLLSQYVLEKLPRNV